MKLIPASKLQNSYVNIYTCMRNYIWDFQTVEALADLEIETYKRFPNLDVLASDFIKLKSLVGSTDVYHDDDEFQKSFTKYENLLNDTDSIYADLKTFRKVVVVA